jgi:hypothetical protein
MTATLFQPEDQAPRPTSMTRTVEIIASADTIEISQDITRIEMFTWHEDRRTWKYASGQAVAGSTLYAMLELARKAKLIVVAWNDGRRLI